MREAVREALIKKVADITLRKAFNGESTEGMKEAKLAIDEMFLSLERTYGQKAKKPENKRIV